LKLTKLCLSFDVKDVGDVGRSQAGKGFSDLGDEDAGWGIYSHLYVMNKNKGFG